MIETRHTVLGMACSHCAAIVGEEIGRVPGVTDVRVDIAAETVVVRADRPVPRAHIDAAVEEAGYTPAPPPPDPCGTAQPGTAPRETGPPDTARPGTAQLHAAPPPAEPPPTPRS
ncbi:heavy-metal-associated domain-containing protein [Streptomyces sp. CNQ-509]|uniref:heavy-metal-associated domain-containing protein n=1 Tax=Streptomyces sp. CNQ-509 TaxID=444103 RepID=UPI00099BE23D|nr:heavy-metal-associated domain-containing protein [Streptomyces sp. CNQ-509]